MWSKVTQPASSYLKSKVDISTEQSWAKKFGFNQLESNVAGKDLTGSGLLLGG